MHWLRAHLRHVFLPMADTEEGPAALMTRSGISPWLWRLYAVFWLVCLVYTLALLLHLPVSFARLFISLGGGLICATLYLWFIWPHPLESFLRWRSQLPLALFGFTVLSILVMLLSMFDNPAWLWLLVCVSAVAGVIFPLRLAAFIVVLLTLWCLVVGVLRLGWVQAIPLALLVRGLGLDMIGLVVLLGALQQMQRQRQALARLAVAEERLRMTRELHDLLGRNLSAVTLKSALAARLVEADSQRAIAEMREVEQLARTTLREVRGAIAGYRHLTLAGELDGARQIGAAAGIVFTITQKKVGDLPHIEELLAAVIHEGITNVLRHSRATRCQIVLGQTPQQVWIDLTNDGYAAGGTKSGQGQGIVGLRERLATVGGRVTMSQERSGTFCLHAEVPVTEEEPA